MPELVPQFDLTIDGRDAPVELVRDVVEIVVDDSLHLPDMFSLRIFDRELKWVDSDLLAVGTEVEIWASAASQGTRSGASDQLIKGEITALAPSYSETGEAILVVQGYDRSHRLHRGKKSRSFLRVTDSEIAQRIAREVNLRAEVDSTSVVHDYIFQDNQTNLEFLQVRAQRIGYELYVKDKTLHFCRRKAGQEEGPQLEWGRDLRDFRPRLTTMNQVDEVIVRGWDPRTKSAIVSRVTEGQIAPKVGVAQSGGRLARKAFGVPAQLVVVDSPVVNIDEAHAMAQALCDEISGDFIKAEGTCFGDPRIKAGCVVTVLGVGMRFGGKYFVTSATHVHNKEGYTTLFDISGRKPDTLSNLLQRENGSGQGWGIAIGLVTNNRDPDDLGRIKVKFPWLADNEESTWARIAAPRGFFCLPEINDEVLVAFEHGDIHHPYVVGALWNGRDKPPRQSREVISSDGKVSQRVIRSRSGHEIVLDDSSGKEKLIIRDKTGKNEILIDSARNAMTIKVKGELNLEADGEVNIKGRNVTIDGGPKVNVKGGTVNLN